MAQKNIRKKVCYFCEKGVKPDYKEPEILRNFLKENGGMKSSMVTGVCAKHQAMVKKAIERARHLALLPIPEKGEH